MARAVRPGADGDFAAPEFAEARALRCVRERRVTGQAVGQHAHVGRAARIRIVAERHELRVLPPNRARERNEIANRGALNIRAKQDDHIVFGFERGLQLHQRFGGLRDRTGPVSVASQRTAARSPPAGTSHGNLCLAMNLARAAIDRRRAARRDGARRCESARRPADSVASRRCRSAEWRSRCRRPPSWRANPSRFGPSAAARPA